MAIRKAIAEKIKTTAKKYYSKGRPENRSKRIGELYKSGKTDEATDAARSIKRRDKLVGAGSGLGIAYAYGKYKESPYKLDVGISKKEKTAAPSKPASSETSDYKTKAAKVTTARKEQVEASKEQAAANKQRIKATSQQKKATTGKQKVAANKIKVAANSKSIAAAKKSYAANKKKVAANTARYK